MVSGRLEEVRTALKDRPAAAQGVRNRYEVALDRASCSGLRGGAVSCSTHCGVRRATNSRNPGEYGTP